ncbi:MAG TPA: acetamidase/formamidase family protein [Candidatus Limnocylindria bacterium]|jgi:amidase|nr:acetamidase/formamidase family protein [Candidatus Limnocylindria bacterium]
MPVLTPDAQISRDDVVWAFGPTMKPVVTVSPGAVVRLETNDCFHGQVTGEDITADMLDMLRVNAATGPIAVEGAEPGDSLVVELLEVNPGPQGAAMIIPGWGQLIDQVKAPVTRIFRVDGDTIHMNDRVRFPLRPMVGVIGVATGHQEAINFLAGEHGGNLDNSLNGPGATVLLPVRQSGAMLAIGDMHASMGDGEVSGTGVEIDGEVLIRIGLIKGQQSRFPVTELADSWVTHGVTDDDLDEAIRLACDEAARLLVDQWGFTRADAFIFLSVACDVGIAQACHPCPGSVIARVRVPKIDACPAPFRAR